MRTDVRDFLRTLAAERRTIAYRDLGLRFQIPWIGQPIASVLDEIDRAELSAGNPPLTSIVVRQDTIGDAICPDGHPDFVGFFKLPLIDAPDLGNWNEAKEYVREKQLETWARWR